MACQRDGDFQPLRASVQATPKRQASSSNSDTVRLVVARISRSERLACSSEIMCAFLAKTPLYYQSPLMDALLDRLQAVIDPEDITGMSIALPGGQEAQCKGLAWRSVMAGLLKVAP